MEERRSAATYGRTDSIASRSVMTSLLPMPQKACKHIKLYAQNRYFGVVSVAVMRCVFVSGFDGSSSELDVQHR
jgi:hypothetical protein